MRCLKARICFSYLQDSVVKSYPIFVLATLATKNGRRRVPHGCTDTDAQRRTRVRAHTHTNGTLISTVLLIPCPHMCKMFQTRQSVTASRRLPSQ